MHTIHPAGDFLRSPRRPLLASPSPHPLPSLARELESPWAARGLTDLVPPATLAEARVRRDELATLLGRERAAAADFLLALADFDRRRGWEASSACRRARRPRWRRSSCLGPIRRGATW